MKKVAPFVEVARFVVHLEDDMATIRGSPILIVLRFEKFVAELPYGH
jgi:hypothetical protein